MKKKGRALRCESSSSKEEEFRSCEWRVDMTRIVNQAIDAFSWARFARTADACGAGYFSPF